MMDKLQKRTTSKSISTGLVLLLGLASGCQRGPEPAKTVAPDVWALVDDREIARAEVEKAYRGVVQPNTTPSDAEQLAMKMNIVDELITQDVLNAKAAAQGLTASDTEVENALAEQKRSLSDEAFQLELSTRGVTLDDVKRGLRRQLSVQKLFERDIAGKITVTDDDVTAYYNQNKAQFNLTEPQYRIAQIVVTGTPTPQLANSLNDDARTPAEAKTKIDMLNKRLAGGETFSKLASEYSEDPQTAPRGGDLGFVPASGLNQAPPALRAAVLRMQPGNVSTVSQGSNYTIMMLVSKEAAGQRELSTPAVRDGIRDLLRNRQQELLQTAYVQAARNDARIVNNLARQVIESQGKVPAGVVSAPVK